jgi:hypothetical protein
VGPDWAPIDRHAAPHPKRFGLIGGRKYDATAYGNRLAAQGRVEQLLNRGIEGVEVGMQNGAALQPSDWSMAHRQSAPRFGRIPLGNLQ